MSFVWSPRSEAERIIFTLIPIIQGFYAKHGFVVLPELRAGVESEAVVVLPKLDYAKELCAELLGQKSELPIAAGNRWIEKIEGQMKEKRLEVARWEREWSKVEEQFWIEMEQYFPHTRLLFAGMEVRMTRYGTVSSGTWITGEPGQMMYFYLRDDRGIEDMAAMIINQILHLQKEELGITWSRREALMDFVMTRPGMKKLFPRFRPMMHQLSRVPAAVRVESEAYLRELGIPRAQKELEVVGGRVIIGGRVVGHELSTLEKKVVKLLVENQGEMVSYDNLADVVWGVGEFKTYWALNKLVERVRPKLEKLGIDPTRVRSVRGQGYLLS